MHKLPGIPHHLTIDNYPCAVSGETGPGYISKMVLTCCENSRRPPGGVGGWGTGARDYSAPRLGARILPLRGQPTDIPREEPSPRLCCWLCRPRSDKGLRAGPGLGAYFLNCSTWSYQGRWGELVSELKARRLNSLSTASCACLFNHSSSSSSSSSCTR